MKSLFLLSGGLDSSAQIAFWRSSVGPDRDRGMAIFFDYGQRAARDERRASQLIAKHFDVAWMEVAIPFLGEWGGSSLTDHRLQMPQAVRLDNRTDTIQSAKSVWVPNRNAVMINIGAAWAERAGVQRLFVGFNAEEAATFPDNSKTFLERVNASLEWSTKTKVTVECLTLDWTKVEIVEALRKQEKQTSLVFPWPLLWSCYEAGSGQAGQACRVCESCLRFQRATEERSSIR